MATSEGPEAVPSVSDKSPAAKPRIIPTNHLVILRESELDCDLPTAIQRVREDAATSGSRILIVGPDTGRRGEAGAARLPLPLPQLPMSIGQVARCGGAQALESTGLRLRAKIESLDCLLREARAGLRELEDAAPHGLPSSLQKRFQAAQEMLDWIQANAGDLAQDVEGQCRGFQVVELGELLADLRGQIESFFPGLRVNVTSIDADCWGRAAALTEALFLAMVVTAHRIRGEGSVNVDAEQVDGRMSVRVFGLGKPAEVHAPALMERLREIVVSMHGGRILPDSMGPFGAGLVLQLPRVP